MSVPVSELRLQSVKELEKQGFSVDDTYACTINISFSGETAGCVVLFVRSMHEPYFQVNFRRNGDATVLRREWAHGRPLRNPAK